MARRVLDEVRRDLAPDCPRGTLTAWLLALCRAGAARGEPFDGAR